MSTDPRHRAHATSSNGCVFARIALVCLAVLTAMAPAAANADDVLANAPVVRRNLLFRQSRHEVAAVFGATLGDPYVRNLLPGVRYDFHLKDWLSVGADVMVGLPLDTVTTKTVEDKVTKTNESFVMEATHLRLMTGAHVSVAPLVGKFMAFGSLPVNFDFHVNLFLGMASVSGTANIAPTTSLAPGIGGGLRVFVSRLMAITIDMNEVFVDRVLAADRNSKSANPTFQDNLVITGGLSFFMPPDLDRAD